MLSLFGINKKDSGTIRGVPKQHAKRNVPLTEYVRYRLLKELEVMSASDLADRSGTSKATISQIKNNSDYGVGGGAASKFASYWGFRSPADLDHEAARWWLAQGKPAEDLMARPEVLQAVQLIVGLQQASEGEVRAVLADFVGDRWRDRDSDFWTATLLTEIKRDRQRTRLLDAERAGRDAAHKAVRTAQDAKRDRDTPKRQALAPSPTKRRRAS